MPLWYRRSITSWGMLCPPSLTLNATLCLASSVLFNQKNKSVTV